MFSKQDIEKYFLAEKQLGLIFIILGSIAIVIAFVFFFLLKTNFYKGAAVLLLVSGLVQLVASITIYKRSDEDRIRNVYAYDMNPGQLKNEELPRIQAVVKRFATIKILEIVLLAIGIFLVFYFRANTEKAFWYGFGVILAIQALIMFTADYTAEKRAIIYKQGIESFLKKVQG